MRRTIIALAAAWLALAPAQAAAAEATWEQWRPVKGALDIDGPRTDGSMIVMGSAALYLVTPDGDVKPFARGPGGYRDDPYPSEAYLVSSIGGHVAAAGCDWTPDETFLLRAHVPLGVTRVSADGQESGPFVNLPGVNVLTGIAFDNTGAFDHRLLVLGVAGTRSLIFAIDCNGGVQTIRPNIRSLEGDMAVAPPAFGSFGGDLLLTDEFSGRLLAVAPNGVVALVLKAPLPAGMDITMHGLGFVPDGFTARGGSAYHADRGGHGGTYAGNDTIRRIQSADLAAAGVKDGDLLVAAEFGGAMIDVRCVETCTSFLVAKQSRATHGEGKVAFSMNSASQSPSPATPAVNGGGSMLPAGVVVFVGEWGIPTAAFALLALFLLAVAVQAFLRRRQ
jgi:hypothetical protein